MDVKQCKYCWFSGTHNLLWLLWPVTFYMYMLQAAFEMIRFQLRHGNDLLAVDCLRKCDVC